jgi:phage FluMu gp28-like protein
MIHTPTGRGGLAEEKSAGRSQICRAELYFLPYQVRWIGDQSHLRICEKSRQIGLSYADSYDSVRKAAVKGGRNVWVMSRDEAQARQYIRYCKHWANVLKYAAHDWGEVLFQGRDGRPIKVQVLSFATRASIYALSSTPDAIVGKSGHVKLDEFALHKDQRTLYSVAKPVIQWGGTLSIISTHRGIGSLFYELLIDAKERGNPIGWSVHTLPIQTAVEQGLVERINEKAGGTESRAAWMKRQQAECVDQEQWLQEYCCIPADEKSAFITYEMLDACEDASLRLIGLEALERAMLDTGKDGNDPRTAPGQASQLYLGVDLARKHDLCVFDLGEKIGDVVWDRLRIELENKPFAEIRSELYRLLLLAQLKRCCVDASGLGMQLAEEARADFGWKLEPVTFTAAVKEELAFGLRRDLEERKLRLVADDRLRADLRGIKKEVSLSGNFRFLGETQDSHCDRFWAKALRQHAARSPQPIWAMAA